MDDGENGRPYGHDNVARNETRGGEERRGQDRLVDMLLQMNENLQQQHSHTLQEVLRNQQHMLDGVLSHVFNMQVHQHQLIRTLAAGGPQYPYQPNEPGADYFTAHEALGRPRTEQGAQPPALHGPPGLPGIAYTLPTREESKQFTDELNALSRLEGQRTTGPQTTPGITCSPPTIVTTGRPENHGIGFSQTPANQGQMYFPTGNTERGQAAESRQITQLAMPPVHQFGARHGTTAPPIPQGGSFLPVAYQSFRGMDGHAMSGPWLYQDRHYPAATGGVSRGMDGHGTLDQQFHPVQGLTYVHDTAQDVRLVEENRMAMNRSGERAVLSDTRSDEPEVPCDASVLTGPSANVLGNGARRDFEKLSGPGLKSDLGDGSVLMTGDQSHLEQEIPRPHSQQFPHWQLARGHNNEVGSEQQGSSLLPGSNERSTAQLALPVECQTPHQFIQVQYGACAFTSEELQPSNTYSENTLQKTPLTAEKSVNNEPLWNQSAEADQLDSKTPGTSITKGTDSNGPRPGTSNPSSEARVTAEGSRAAVIIEDVNTSRRPPENLHQEVSRIQQETHSASSQAYLQSGNHAGSCTAGGEIRQHTSLVDGVSSLDLSSFQDPSINLHSGSVQSLSLSCIELRGGGSDEGIAPSLHTENVEQSQVAGEDEDENQVLDSSE